MTWLLAILLFICLLCSWLLAAAVIIEIDSRAAAASVRWVGIGRVAVYYEEEWWMRVQVFFFYKKFRLAGMEKKRAREKAANRKAVKTPRLKKMLRVVKTFTVKEWQLAVDTGDVTWNARLYPLNFMPGCYSHININFSGENYCCARIQNRPWKILFAFLR